MNIFDKNQGENSDKTHILIVGVLFLFTLFFPLIFSDESPLSAANEEDVCQQLSTMRTAEMSSKQKKQAQQCDARDAEQAWENQYGTMSEHDKTDAVVYE